MNIDTLRFGNLDVQAEDIIVFEEGLLGLGDLHRFFIVDPNDDTLILWLQSLDKPEIAFPVLEPKIFSPDYLVRLSAQELRQLKLENINKAKVFTLLTIPSNLPEMTANTKAPIVINLGERIARQVVLQESVYTVKQPIFKELRVHLVTLANMKNNRQNQPEEELGFQTVNISSLTPSGKMIEAL